MSETEPPRPTVPIDPSDIQATDVPRRSFLRGLGILTGTLAVTTAASGCELLAPSDTCDSDRSDSDP